ncbi:hypothetical protein J3Q64DRAFT_1694729 [Phycomyces blakesleeanus]|uniref:Uncharacterized protein n=2 Tax=Phycomyces blakesleeanus TaxID=4837 RepID=A0A167Q0Z1_PHYB8|nr:hypothetical protein PHYBLDRAFT_62363 [Phycomyces blakesleeanus NRRL 1555(-)]OAD78876.1 hypothetical protein PHYBLDRAFT_62363 [Phycomyces blakesleeanus NRRL 1555(-)]|eukprot:XP_018296916.1 hypothetical protein PHYBLDRAFT_62363 [Phycomyces blakesleeanus NRRL 1555(-)]
MANGCLISAQPATFYDHNGGFEKANDRATEDPDYYAALFTHHHFKADFSERYQNQTPPCHSELNEPLDKSREQKFGTKCEFAHQIKCTLLTNLLCYRDIGLS